MDRALVSLLVLALWAISSMHEASASPAISMGVHKLRRHPSLLDLRDLTLQADTGLHVANLHGSLNATAEYFVRIELGEPPQKFLVQVDTGSVALAVPGIECKTYRGNAKTNKPCVHADAFYSPTATSSAVPCGNGCAKCHNNTCAFELRYGDGSFVYGTQRKDRLTLAGLSANVTFGVIVAEAENFAITSLDGIMGFAYQSLDPDNGDDCFAKIVKANNMPNTFSMCLGKHGGALVLGGVDAKYQVGDMKYTPLLREEFYQVAMTDVKVGDVSIGVPTSAFANYTVIADSGTTLLAVPAKMYRAMRQTFEKHFSALPGVGGSESLFEGYCYNFDADKKARFPGIHVTLGSNVELIAKPDNYFVSVVYQGHLLQCLGVASLEEDVVILGDVLLQAYNVEYNRQTKSIGFAPAKDCDGPGLFLEIVRGKNDTLTVGGADKAQVRVRYADGIQRPAAGIPVEFEVVSGKASLKYALVASDDAGIASAGVEVDEPGSVLVNARILDAPWRGANVTLSFEAKDDDSGNRLWIILGVSAAGLMAVVLAAAIAMLVVKWKKRKEERDYKEFLRSVFDDNSFGSEI